MNKIDQWSSSKKKQPGVSGRGNTLACDTEEDTT